jgi:hypothetical protein
MKRHDLARLRRDVERLRAVADAREDDGGKMLTGYLAAIFALGGQMEADGTIETWVDWLVDDSLPDDVRARLLAAATA